MKQGLTSVLERSPWGFVAFRARTLAVFLLASASFLEPAVAGRPTGRHRVARPVSADVQPTPEIDAHVAEEVAKAGRVLADLDANSLFDSPYLVSAIYYHDGFLTDFPADRTTADPERRIIAQISRMLSAEQKSAFIQLLHETWLNSKSVGPRRFVAPVTYKTVSAGGRTHRYAVDLFAAEGADVHSVSRGIVVLADSGWSREDLFSTTSRKGGNAVIVFDPDGNRFYRYCHLSAVQVSAGEILETGHIIGNVGHTGLNASQAGHGGHLHFEVNEYGGGRVRALDSRQLRAMLRNWR